MIAFIQSLEAHVFTFKEVAGYVTISVCMSFAVGFLIAAYTRIFKEDPKKTGDYVDWSKIPAGYGWVAVDGFGIKPCIFTSRPKPIKSKDWRTNKKDYIYAPKDAIIGPLPPWRESLRRRPS